MAKFGKVFLLLASLALPAFLFFWNGCASSRPDLVWSADRTQSGIASWYSYPFHGKRASNGEIYNMNALTAAHPSLALNSIVEVTNEKNGKKVLVRINDRLPPNDKGRIIDLSECAARKLDIITSGIAPVTLRVITYGNNRYAPTDLSAPDGKIYLRNQSGSRRTTQIKKPALEQSERSRESSLKNSTYSIKPMGFDES